MRRIVGLSLSLGLLAVGQARAEFAFGMTASNILVSFDTANPAGFNVVGTFTGLTAGHAVRAIDFRPNGGQLYALSTNTSTLSEAQVYTVDTATAVLTPRGGGFTLTGANANVSMDFNPFADRLRIISGVTNVNTDTNHRWNPVTEAFVQSDANLRYVDGNAGSAEVNLDVAYDFNFAGANTTTMYTIDFAFDRLTRVGSVGGSPTSPNSGEMTAIGSLGVDPFASAGGFDISGLTGTAYALMNTNDHGAGSFYTIDLQTGAATFVGSFGVASGLRDFSVVPEPSTYAMLAAAAGLGLAVRRRKAKANA